MKILSLHFRYKYQHVSIIIALLYFNKLTKKYPFGSKLKYHFNYCRIIYFFKLNLMK